jgi:endonuclease YncB( thermonuclease family)
VNIELIRNGFAMCYYLKKNKNCEKEKYLNNEALAKLSKVNIWSDSSFIEPWKFRKIKKNEF